jgi:Leucine-rich repeat (LRR) protein
MKNQLTCLPKWDHLTKLKIINCCYNNLRNLPKWDKLINLEEIYCINNLLTSLPEWDKLIKLKEINCSYNQLTYLPEWQQLFNLKSIYCYNNDLTNIPEWQHLINLKSIYCNNNRLTYLPITWTRLYNLQYIGYSGNPIEYIPPNLLRIINSTGQNIYNDKQNIHNHHIQKCLYNSVQYLIKDKPSISIDQMRQEIENECLSFELIVTYCKDQTVHTILNVTFEEVLLSVWCKIRNNINKQEIIKILNIEMLDSECKCFTGRLTRLVNCLSGFDNNISITINNNEQMSNISRILYDKHGDNIEDYQKELRKEFEERGYSDEHINIWSNI